MIIEKLNIGQIPKNVSLSLKDNTLNIKGKYSNIDIPVLPGLKFVTSKENFLVVYYKKFLVNNIKVIITKIKNALVGVSSLFHVRLSLVGVGYRFSLSDNILSMRIGYNHPVDVPLENDISCKLITPTEILLLCNDLQKLVLFASKVRNFKKPEVYKGKGIRFSTEVITLKKVQVK
jgi:large subunit ribosomal protein L6